MYCFENGKLKILKICPSIIIALQCTDSCKWTLTTQQRSKICMSKNILYITISQSITSLVLFHQQNRLFHPKDHQLLNFYLFCWARISRKKSYINCNSCGRLQIHNVNQLTFSKTDMIMTCGWVVGQHAECVDLLCSLTFYNFSFLHSPDPNQPNVSHCAGC